MNAEQLIYSINSVPKDTDVRISYMGSKNHGLEISGCVKVWYNFSLNHVLIYSDSKDPNTITLLQHNETRQKLVDRTKELSELKHLYKNATECLDKRYKRQIEIESAPFITRLKWLFTGVKI